MFVKNVNRNYIPYGIIELTKEHRKQGGNTMKRLIIEDRKVIVGTGEELTPVVKSMWRAKEKFVLFEDRPKLNPYKMYGICEEDGTVLTADVIVSYMLEDKIEDVGISTVEIPTVNEIDIASIIFN